MTKYYTRACNFYYGNLSKKLVKNKKSLPLCGKKQISFNQIEIFSKNKKKVSSKIVNINEINYFRGYFFFIFWKNFYLIERNFFVAT